MSSPPHREEYDSFEEWITALAAESDSDPLNLVDEIIDQMDETTDN